MSLLIASLIASGLSSNEELISTKNDTYKRSDAIQQIILENVEKKKEEALNKSDDTNIDNDDTILEQVNEEYILKPSAFKLYLERYKMKNEILEIKINSPKEMREFISKLFSTLPHTVYVSSDKYQPQQLKKLYQNSLSLIVADTTPTKHGLADYSTRTTNRLILTDITNKDYNAATIKKAVDMYAKDLVEVLKGKTEKETIDNIYDFMFRNFKYTASSWQSMVVGNLAKGEMACNGFSYLADRLFEEANIPSFIRAGNSHFWNVLTLKDGSEVTFDVTTDIVLNKYKATLGTSTEAHIAKAGSIGFYSAIYPKGKYHKVASNPLFK